jgi:hypothetical protein
MPALLQDVVVTLAALWAVWVVVRRVGLLVAPGQRRTVSCDNCANGPSGAGAADGAAKPLTLVRDRQ